MHPLQSRFAASTTGKNPYVRPRAPCTSAPPHADGEEWGGLDRDVFSRAAGARCLGSSEGCPARPVVSLTVDGRPIPMALRHRHVLERLWSERGGRRPPWDLLRLPAPRRICTSGAAPAHAGARSSAPGGSLPVVPRGGRSRRAAWTGGPSRRLCARFTLRTRHPPGGVAGAAAGLRRGRPARAPRRHAARRGRPGAFSLFEGGLSRWHIESRFVYFVFGRFAAFSSTIYMRKRNMLILVVLEWYIDLDPSNVEMALSGAQNRMAPFGHHMKVGRWGVAANALGESFR